MKSLKISKKKSQQILATLIEGYFGLSEENRAKDPAAAGAMEKALMNELTKI